MCSNASYYLNDFREAAKKQGGVVGIEGDQPCGPGVDAAYRTYSWDAGRQHQRIEAALAAAGVKEIPAAGITLVGYSQGAAIAEQLAATYPGRYSRIVLIGAPKDPAPRDFAKTRGLVTMACDRDVTARMKGAATSASRAGIPATYFQMPNCTHGQVNDAEHIFGESFDWLSANERPGRYERRRRAHRRPGDLNRRGLARGPLFRRLASMRTGFAIVLSLSLCSCALVFRGSSDEVKIESTPPGAQATSGLRKIGPTPNKMIVDRQGSTPITLVKEGYEDNIGRSRRGSTAPGRRSTSSRASFPCSFASRSSSTRSAARGSMSTSATSAR